MKTKLSFLAILFLLFFISGNTFAQNNNAEEYWAQWRGPLATGAAIKGNPPLQFSETQNVKWKIPIPGKGHATPIVWGDKIIIETAVPTGIKVESNDEIEEDGNSWMEVTSTDLVLDYKVIMVSLTDGQVIWDKTVTSEKPQENTHQLGSWASNSPCTDGEFIYAYFGSRGIFCLDFEGNIIWEKDFGQMEKRMSFGEGASPYLHNNRLFILWDHEGESFIVCLDTKTGDEIWKKKRENVSSWSSPFVTEVNGKLQVIASSTKVISYDYETGEEIWSVGGMTNNVIPNPKIADGILYLSSGFRGNATMAIDLAKAKGDITGSDVILWSYNKDCPYTPDNLLMNDRLYFMRANNGELTCLNAKTGEVIYSKERLEGISDLYSSPTGVNDRIYIVSENICLVVKAGDTFEILSSNELNDDFHASPVIVGDNLILRGFSSLYCFSE